MDGELAMPLKKSSSKEAFRANVKAEIDAGKKPAQAVAIAYSVKRESTKKRQKMKLKPFGERIVVKQKEEELTTASGIVLAKQAEKKFEGVIVAAGQGAILDNGTVRAMTVKVGDTILFGEYSGQKFKYEDEDYLLMNEKDVIGILNE